MGGQDATEAFEDVGHSDEAREILEGLLVGALKRQVRTPSIAFVDPVLPACAFARRSPWAPLHTVAWYGFGKRKALIADVC